MLQKVLQTSVNNIISPSLRYTNIYYLKQPRVHSQLYISSSRESKWTVWIQLRVRFMWDRWTYVLGSKGLYKPLQTHLWRPSWVRAVTPLLHTQLFRFTAVALIQRRYYWRLCILYIKLFLVLESDWLRGCNVLVITELQLFASLRLQYAISHRKCYGGHPNPLYFINNTVFVSWNVIFSFFRWECSCLGFKYVVC